MRWLSLLLLVACWVTPKEIEDKIDELEPTDTAAAVDTGVGDTGL